MFSSRKVKYENLTFFTGCKVLPPPGYSAITLFGTVLTRKSKEEVERYLDTDRGKIWAHHEAMHVHQKEAVGSWLLFYTLYIWHFIIAWPWHMSWRQAYKTIPFELEAYDKQNKMCIKTSEWENYAYSIDKRKKIEV